MPQKHDTRYKKRKAREAAAKAAEQNTTTSKGK